MVLVDQGDVTEGTVVPSCLVDTIQVDRDEMPGYDAMVVEVMAKLIETPVALSQLERFRDAEEAPPNPAPLDSLNKDRTLDALQILHRLGVAGLKDLGPKRLLFTAVLYQYLSSRAAPLELCLNIVNKRCCERFKYPPLYVRHGWGFWFRIVILRDIFASNLSFYVAQGLIPRPITDDLT